MGTCHLITGNVLYSDPSCTRLFLHFKSQNNFISNLIQNMELLQTLLFIQSRFFKTHLSSNLFRVTVSARLCVTDFSRDVIPVNVWLLKEHVKTSLVLSQRMSSDSGKKIRILVNTCRISRN